MLPPGTAFLALLFVVLPTAALAGADGGTPVRGPFAVGLPDRPWRLLIDLPGFEIGPIQRREGGARVRGTDERAGLVVSLTLATSPGDTSARSCRDHDWAGRQRVTLDRQDTQLGEQGDQARVEYLIPRIEGDPVQQKNVLLYLQREGVCIVVHLSKVLYQTADATTLERILASVRLGS